MIARWLVIAPLTVAIGLACCVMAQKHLDASRQTGFDEELLYLPNEKLLNHFTGGLDSVVADLLWLQCIQYTAEEFKGDHKYVWLNHMTDTITRLDPYFVDVYRYGGVFLAALKADNDASVNLMKRGMRHNPGAWVLPYEIAMVYLLNRKDRPDSPAQAARFLHLAVATETPPQFVVDLAANIARQHDLDAFERAMWEDMARNSDEKMLRELAQRKLHELAIAGVCGQLAKAVELYENRHKRLPKSLGDLVSGGIIESVPDDPLGGRYVLSGREVLNTTLQDEKLGRRLNRIRGGVQRYQKRTGVWPPSLETAVKEGDLEFVPPHPYPGREWRYDPATGEVESGAGPSG
ncbi:MAG: hypothetical protein RBT84_08500 [FCB group bacterium]|jgi:hypothetical protein|nr:hypothetical protein [FCB group bacterium]